MKKSLLIVAILLVLIASIVLLRMAGERRTAPVSDLMNRCMLVDLGMSRSEVLEILEDPKRRAYVFNGTITEEQWYYHSGKTVSTPVLMTFDSANGRVVDVLCGEDRSGVRRPHQ